MPSRLAGSCWRGVEPIGCCPSLMWSESYTSRLRRGARHRRGDTRACLVGGSILVARPSPISVPREDLTTRVRVLHVFMRGDLRYGVGELPRIRFGGWRELRARLVRTPRIRHRGRALGAEGQLAGRLGIAKSSVIVKYKAHERRGRSASLFPSPKRALLAELARTRWCPPNGSPPISWSTHSSSGRGDEPEAANERT